jgi:pre-mRNA cleavage complex 2 protein Pcf11
LQNATTKKDPKKQWLPVPSDPALANLHCPICQEKFVTVWLDEAQEWVWMDAVKVGGRTYHASCHEEATKDRGPSPARNSTPDSLLGKRKAAESDLTESKVKMKKESAS